MTEAPTPRADADLPALRRGVKAALFSGYLRERLSCRPVLHLIGSIGCASPSDFLCL
jgi:hypothetical protein